MTRVTSTQDTALYYSTAEVLIINNLNHGLFMLIWSFSGVSKLRENLKPRFAFQ